MCFGTYICIYTMCTKAMCILNDTDRLWKTNFETVVCLFLGVGGGDGGEGWEGYTNIVGHMVLMHSKYHTQYLKYAIASRERLSYCAHKMTS